MERRVRQHHAELGGPGSHRVAHRGIGPAAREHDRPRAVREQVELRRLQVHELADGVHVRRHQRERLVLAVLARTQLGDGRRVVRAAGEVEAADALHRDDGSIEQRAGGGLDGVARTRVLESAAARVREPHLRPAVRAGVGLGMEAAVGRVAVLGQAGRAHLERRHRGVRPVVGHVAHDREARPAVGAVREGVAEAPVGGVEQLGQAVCAGGAVGRDRGVRLASGGALPDREASLAHLLELLGRDPFDARQWRRLAREPGEEALDGLGRRLRLHDDPARVVQHVAGHAQLVGEPVHVRAEAHALHRPLDAGADPAHPSSTSSRSRWYALACASWMRGMCSERVTITWSASRSADTRPPS